MCVFEHNLVLELRRYCLNNFFAYLFIFLFEHGCHVLRYNNDNSLSDSELQANARVHG